MVGLHGIHLGKALCAGHVTAALKPGPTSMASGLQIPSDLEHVSRPLQHDLCCLPRNCKSVNIRAIADGSTGRFHGSKAVLIWAVIGPKFTSPLLHPNLYPDLGLYLHGFISTRIFE